ncbi:hypothetical protein CLI75_09345 [Porphyromonas gingivalis]|nr:hypothetical protein CS544_04505 [Porphyromonas gingivalis]ATR94770.1 hypothetical protein CS546_06920 [Porphyromonas gingivalis]ATS07052.1 hypothetical protein CS387_08850 [Porphyromonas gingivalis]PDP55817.1 hypothetical protein CLI75_09345 [Porphyromonas gingivalis]
MYKHKGIPDSFTKDFAGNLFLIDGVDSLCPEFSVLFACLSISLLASKRYEYLSIGIFILVFLVLLSGSTYFCDESRTLVMSIKKENRNE